MLKSSSLSVQRQACLLFSLWLWLACAVFAQTTAFTYQGRLTDGGSPANGPYDLQFNLFNMSSGGSSLGTQTLSNVTVTNGIFTVQLDFGSNVFTGNTGKFLEIGVRTAGGPSFTTLPQRQPVNATPYAIQSISATSFSGNLSGDVTGTQSATAVSQVGGQTAANVASGASAANAATSANTPNTIVKRDASGNFSAGTITGTLNGNATNVTGTVAIANGGTGATSATNARTNLGLGSLATLTPTGTADGTTFLRGDNTWSPVAAGGTTIFSARTTSTTINSNSFVDVVSVNLEANKTYYFDGGVLAQRVGASTTLGNMRVTYTGNATTDYGIVSNGALLAGTTFSTTSFDYETGTASTNQILAPVGQEFVASGYIKTTTAGTLALKIARGATNTTNDFTVREGTYLRAIPMN